MNPNCASPAWSGCSTTAAAFAAYDRLSAETEVSPGGVPYALLAAGARCELPAKAAARQVAHGRRHRLGSTPAKFAKLGTLTTPAIVLYPSRDDRAIYIFRTDPAGEILRWEITMGRETILDRFPVATIDLVSQDERWLLRISKQNIQIRPLAGGDWRPLVSFRQDFLTGHANLTADGNWLIYQDLDSAGKHSLFRVATTGGQPERLGDFPTSSQIGSLEVSPDGRNIVVSADEYVTRYELWSLENFVPPAPKP